MSGSFGFLRAIGWKILGLALVGSLLEACAPGVIVRKDPNADLERYRSYRWVTADAVGELHLRDPSVDGPISEPVHIVTKPELEKRLKPIIESELAAAGFVPDQTGKPDFYVTFYGKSPDEEWISSWTGMTPAIQHVPLVIFPGYAVSSARSYREGFIYLTLYDRVTKRPVWTGSLNRSRYGGGSDDKTLTAEARDLVRAFKP